MADYEQRLTELLNCYVTEVSNLQDEEKFTNESTIVDSTKTVIEDITLMLNEIEDRKVQNESSDYLEEFQLNEKNTLGEALLHITETLSQEKCRCRDLNVSLKEKSEELQKCIDAQDQADVRFKDKKIEIVYKRCNELKAILEQNKCIIELGKEVENIINSKDKLKYFWEQSALIFMKSKLENMQQELRAETFRKKTENSKIKKRSNLSGTVHEILHLNQKPSREFYRHSELLRKTILLCISEINILSKLKAQLTEGLEKAKLVCITTLRHKEMKSQSAVRKFKLGLADLIGDRDHKIHKIESNYKNKIQNLKCIINEKHSVVTEYQEEIARIKFENSELQVAVEDAHDRLEESSVKIGELEIANLELQKRLRVTESNYQNSFNKTDLHKKINNADIPNIHVEKNLKTGSKQQQKYEKIKKRAVTLSPNLERVKLINKELSHRNRELEEKQSKCESDTKTLVTENGPIHQDKDEDQINHTRKSREEKRCEKSSKEKIPPENLPEPNSRETTFIKQNVILKDELQAYDKDRYDLLNTQLTTLSNQKHTHNGDVPSVSEKKTFTQRDRTLAEEHLKKPKRFLESTPLNETAGKRSRKKPCTKEVVRRPRWK